MCNAAPAFLHGSFTGSSLLWSVQPDCGAADSFGPHIKKHEGWVETVGSFENISNSFGSTEPMNPRIKNTVCLTFMKVRKKAVNCYLLC